jgi:hypothetical protein
MTVKMTMKMTILNPKTTRRPPLRSHLQEEGPLELGLWQLEDRWDMEGGQAIRITALRTVINLRPWLRDKPRANLL